MGGPVGGEVQAARLGIHLSIAQVCRAVFTRRRVYSSKALTSEVHKGYGVELLTTGTIMGVLDDLSGPAQKCSALFLHLSQNQQVVLECVYCRLAS